jgi:midasin
LLRIEKYINFHLKKAVSSGNWILLEDFDHSPVDTLSLLIDLLETKCIKTSDSILNMKSNFRLFLTLRSTEGKRLNMIFIDSIKKLSRYVILDSFKDSEIIQIICSIYPYFSSLASSTHIAEKLLDIYKGLSSSNTSLTMMETDEQQSISAGFKANLIRDARTLSLRDLLKLCNRLVSEKNHNPNSIEHRNLLVNLFYDIYECFLCFLSNKEARIECATRIGCLFNINKDEVLNLLLNNKPNFQKSQKELICGRVKLKLELNLTGDANQQQKNLLNESSCLSLASNNSKFVYTKSSLSLIEKIARCIECNEPVLLCGETGVGKTTALQHLARLLGKTINIINLNQQTETSDLLGSFKPVDIKSQMKIVKEKFVNLFTKCFNIDENQTFLNHVQTCFSSAKWTYLIKLVLHGTDSAYKKYQNDRERFAVFKEWKDLKGLVNKFEENFENIKEKFSFQFFEVKKIH